MVFTKEYINELKRAGNGALRRVITNLNDSGSLVCFLERLGYLPKDFDGEILVSLLQHENPQVRLLAVKNIGKLEDVRYLQPLSIIAENDPDSMARREAVSAIGRMRDPQNKSLLLKYLDDTDPKIVLQAIRGLVVFKDEDAIRQRLRQLLQHPNELVQSFIQELFAKKGENEVQPHCETYGFLKNEVVQGDVREVLSLVPGGSIHLTFTSPPYRTL